MKRYGGKMKRYGGKMKGFDMAGTMRAVFCDIAC